MNSSKHTKKHSDYISSLLGEVEKYRLMLGAELKDEITLQDALLLWIKNGYARKFRRNYPHISKRMEPANA